jgi:hypothetical protein
VKKLTFRHVLGWLTGHFQIERSFPVDERMKSALEIRLPPFYTPFEIIGLWGEGGEEGRQFKRAESNDVS